MNFGIGPINAASQGALIARALRIFNGVNAISISKPNFPYYFETDIDLGIVRAEKLERILKSLDFVIIEYSTGFQFTKGANLERTISFLEENNINYAFLSHGSEIRLPSKHRKIHPESCHNKIDKKLNDELEDLANKNLKFIKSTGKSHFVTTDDLLYFDDNAKLLPLVVSPEFINEYSTLKTRNGKPIFMHHVSDSRFKDSEFIIRELEKLHEKSIIDLVKLSSLKNTGTMPHSLRHKIVKMAEVFVDQIGLGAWGVSALENMASGRLVLVDLTLTPDRDTKPAFHVTRENFTAVVMDLLDQRGRWPEFSERAAEYVRRNHNGELTARVLINTLKTKA
jgi:hypothetical protein